MKLLSAYHFFSEPGRVMVYVSPTCHGRAVKKTSGAKNYEINGGLQVIAKRLLPPVCACAMLWLAAYALCLNKNAPSLASCNLNKH